MKERAMDFLRAELGSGKRLAKDVLAAAKKRGLIEKTLDRARKDLGVIAWKPGKVFWWRLPGEDEGQHEGHP